MSAERAVQAKGWVAAHRWLLLRRLSQLSIWTLFLAGPLAGVWWIKGNLSSSRLFDTVPLSDPFVIVQVLASGHLPEATALLGAAIVTGVYALAGGRSFCSWVCPVNPVTDLAAWLRRRLGFTSGRTPARSLRRWLLLAVLLACALTGVTVWEWVNPVSLTQRAIVFGGTIAWTLVLGIFLYDLLIAPRGWCGHVCPHGALYGLLGRATPLAVSAHASSRCNDCGDCYVVCPEPQVIVLPLKGKGGARPVIDYGDCTRCGRCIDVCSTEVFRFTHRWDNRRI